MLFKECFHILNFGVFNVLQLFTNGGPLIRMLFINQGSQAQPYVTISVGVARTPAPGMAASGDLVARADEAMYAAKRGGRNRVCSADA